MDVSKYVMFSVVFVYVDEVVLGYCSKSPLNTRIPGDFCLKFSIYHTVGRNFRFFCANCVVYGHLFVRYGEFRPKECECDVPPVDAWKTSCVEDKLRVESMRNFENQNDIFSKSRSV